MVRYIDIARQSDDPAGIAGALQPRSHEMPWESGSRPVGGPGAPQAEAEAEIYLALRNHLLAVKTCLLERREVRLEPLQESIQRVIDPWESVDRLYHYTSCFGHEEDFTASHSINTMLYSLKIGRSLDYSREDLEALGLAALLHDVGMFAIPDSILKKPGGLTDEETARIRKHTDIGREILSAWAREMPFLSRVAHEHHERQDGSGYPRGVEGDQVFEFSKIVGLADVYEAMTHDRPHRRATSVRKLIDTKNRAFPQRVMKAFLEQISFYPMGSVIRLNNRMVGRVVATNAGQPLRPVVKILTDAQGNPAAEDKTVNLLGNPIVWVTGPVAEKELPSIEP